MNYMIKGEKCMKKNQKHKTLDYDFSDYAEEITGNALFKINGGAEVENSHEGVAGAKPGDTITRIDGTVVTLKQADIDYANAQLGNNGNDGTGNTNGNSGTGNISNSNNTSNGYQNYSGAGSLSSCGGEKPEIPDNKKNGGGDPVKENPSNGNGGTNGYNPTPNGTNRTEEATNNIKNDNWTNHVPLQNQAAAKEYYERTTQRNEYYIKKYNINPYLPTDVKIKLVQKELDHQFALAVSSYIGTDYVFGGKSRKGIDCSGTITESLKDMGYKIKSRNADSMGSGEVDWITILPYATKDNAGNEGILNFYRLNGSEKINHTNVGVGSYMNHPEDLSIYFPQIVDATESDWICSRNSNSKQYIPAQAGKVNQTYAPFSTNEQSYPVVQARINWEVLDEKYRF